MLKLLIVFVPQLFCNIDLKNLYKKHAVSSELPEASKIGLKVLQNGGNSVDAAIATCLAVGVVNAFSSGLGGGGFMLIKQRGLNEKATMIDFREKAPINFKIDVIINDRIKSKVGGAAVAIPCEIKGLWHAHKKFGKMPWKDLFIDSIKLCDGFTVTKELAKRIKKFEKEIFQDPGLRETYSENGILKKEGDIIVRENLKRTLIFLQNKPDAFYDSEITESLIDFINQHGGDVTKDDFKNNVPIEREPLSDYYYGYKVTTTTLPSSGILIIEALKLLEKLKIKEVFNIKENNKTYMHIHLLLEVFKLVMKDRGKLGDPNFLRHYKETLETIQNLDHIETLKKKIKYEKVLTEQDYVSNKFNVVDSGTTHINVIDSNDLIATLTSTVNLEFGAKIMDPVTGIILNNQMDDFYYPANVNTLQEESSVPNLARARQVPLSSAAPVIIENSDEAIILGAAGGIRIPTSIIEVIFWLTLGLNLDDAIKKPRFHHQSMPNVVYVESSENASVINYLKNLGHIIESSITNTVFTSVQGIIVKGFSNKIIHAVSDVRKGGKSAGD